MSTPLSERLASARKNAGFEGPHEAAAALGVNRFSYTQHENGTRGFKRDAAVQYSRKFKVSLEWLLTGRGDPKPKSSPVPVTQYVGAGAQMVPFPDQGTLEEETWPTSMANCEAAIIRGDSMPPFQDGWLIIWRNENEGITDQYVGKLCVVDVKEGPTLLKVLRRGSKRGLWNLESWKGAVRKDVVLNSASPVLYIRPR